MTPVIECAGVSKAFILRTNRQYLLKERALGLLRPHLREAREQFWALHDISFAVEAGEMFGLIGANGAGKSTLLRIVAGIFQPTAGAIRVRGRVAALLGLGVGFHQELTGRENIYLGAALFGFTTREIRALESSIIEFAELGQFIDVPVKNYSRACRSGWVLHRARGHARRLPDRRGSGRGGRAFPAEVPQTAQARAEGGVHLPGRLPQPPVHREPMRSRGPDRQRSHGGAGSVEGSRAIL